MSEAALQQLRVLSDVIVDGLAIVSTDGIVLDANPSLGQLVEQPPHSLVGADVTDLVIEKHRTTLRELLADDDASGTIEVALAGPNSADVSIQLRRIELDGAAANVLTFHDLRARRSAEELGRSASYDPLTGLSNRLGLQHALAAEQARAERYGANYAVLCLDLDGFKAINDGHGHPAGDEALRIVARRLSETTRETDHVFRLGGDEFLILQAYTTEPHQSVRLAERLIKAIGRPLLIGDLPLHLGVSIGIAYCPNHGTIGEELLQNADAALYKAKREGKNTYRFFDPSLDEALRRRRAIETELMHAIDRGELDLVYQPQLEVASGTVMALEAQLCWHSSRLGLVDPAVFLPIAEQAGLMTALGEWTLHKACRQAASWGRPLCIAVAMSLFQVRTSDISLIAQQSLDVSGLDPARLRISVSEATLLQDAKATSETLAKLKALDVQVGLDEFGSGTSSLSAIADGTFDLVRLGNVFADEHAKNSRRLDAIIAACRSLGLRVGATAVATPAMREMLIEAGVDSIQGEVVSPAGPIDRFAPFVGSRSPAAARSGEARSLGSLRDLLRPFGPAAIPVLVVDDSEIVSATLAAMLAGFGFSDVSCATDGEAAWNLLSGRRFGLVISDWNMEPVSGIELLGRMRADPTFASIRFLMLTANARSASRIAARNAGVDGFLVKPFRPDALASKILDVLSSDAQFGRTG
ncbi:MAG: EAL domain-containing protein [Methylobacterium sp.]|uniref:EAL domain-containing protein n=1 Tax=Methylobacterium sp. TaxID=409 RepID=UPI0025D012DF|nr:EAL domain-containing protein [Methylobacterium sp.]MBX9932713.1 EAL domain-containing protein [Methylobacterium sp.]